MLAQTFKLLIWASATLRKCVIVRCVMTFDCNGWLQLHLFVRILSSVDNFRFNNRYTTLWLWPVFSTNSKSSKRQMKWIQQNLGKRIYRLEAASLCHSRRCQVQCSSQEEMERHTIFVSRAQTRHETMRLIYDLADKSAPNHQQQPTTTLRNQIRPPFFYSSIHHERFATDARGLRI